MVVNEESNGVGRSLPPKGAGARGWLSATLVEGFPKSNLETVPKSTARGYNTKRTSKARSVVARLRCHGRRRYFRNEGSVSAGPFSFSLRHPFASISSPARPQERSLLLWRPPQRRKEYSPWQHSFTLGAPPARTLLARGRNFSIESARLNEIQVPL